MRHDVPTSLAAPRKRGGQPRTNRRDTATAYAFLLPGFAFFGLTVLWPLVKAFQISFYDWKVFPGMVSPFVGFANYERAFGDPVFWRALQNSAAYMVLTVPAQVILGLLAAVLLNAKVPGRTTFRVLYYLPVVTSWVVVTLLFQYMFTSQGGVFNWVLHDVLHVTSTNISWFASRWPAMIALAILGVWKGIGWSMIIFLAALQSVNPELVEAAAIDGAGAIRRFLSVTLPAIRRTATFVTVMLVIGGFNVFISVYLMTGGGPSGETEVLLTYMYRQAFSFLDFGYGSAIAFLLTGVILTLSLLQWRFLRPGDAE